MTSMDETPVPQLRQNGSDIFKLTVANAIRGVANTPANLTQQWVSLHTDDPEYTGAFELTGGGYARKQVTWNAAIVDDGKGKLVAPSVTFDVPAVKITHYAVWNVATGAGNGTSTGYLYGKELSAAVQLNAAGKITITPTHLYGLL